MNATSTRVFAVNPDNDTVTSIQTVSYAKLQEIRVGSNPRTVAFAPDETAWVVCQDDATIHVVHAQTNATLAVIDVLKLGCEIGSQFDPIGIPCES